MHNITFIISFAIDNYMYILYAAFAVYATEGETIAFPWKLPHIKNNTGLVVRHSKHVIVNKTPGKVETWIQNHRTSIHGTTLLIHPTNVDDAGIYSIYLQSHDKSGFQGDTEVFIRPDPGISYHSLLS